MCNTIVLATDCPDDLHIQYATDLLSVYPVNGIKDAEDASSALSQGYHWDLNRTGMCGCHFWNEIPSWNPGTGECDFPRFDTDPDPAMEDGDNLEATAKIYDMLLEIVNRGFWVELFNAGDPDQLKSFGICNIKLADISRGRFRLVENYVIRMER